MNWWNNMETTFGFVMGGVLGLGLWLNRQAINLGPEADEATLSTGLEVGLMLVHTFRRLDGLRGLGRSHL